MLLNIKISFYQIFKYYLSIFYLIFFEVNSNRIENDVSMTENNILVINIYNS